MTNQTHLGAMYREGLGMLTDLYELTMAYGYWKLGRADEEAVFHLSFRNNPFHGGFTVACGLADVVEYLNGFRFDATDVAYLASLTGNDGRPLFDRAFVEDLGRLKLRVDLDAIPEGTVVFAGEPLLRVTGPLLQCQLLETALLNLINFPTLVATKAARICHAAAGEPVLEFGLRRAQGIDGAVTASRAAYIGGCAGTSNVLAGKLFDIPVRGTHAHSWVMSFDDELQAFEQYASVMPNNCVLLVDTYDTLQGVRHAAEIGRRLRAAGHKLIGVRLDSGDLAYLSIEARKILDAAGLTDAAILASNDLDEHLIESLHLQGAKITTWGVGTRLATAYDQPALGGVYKLGAMKNPATGQWDYKIKLSEHIAKVSTPGVLQVRRFRRSGMPVADAVYSETLGIPPRPTIVDPQDSMRRRTTEADAVGEDLLVPVFRRGQVVYRPPTAQEARERAQKEIASLHPTIRRLLNPHQYPVGLEKRLAELRMMLVLAARRDENGA